jgi:hypothetical protein
VKDETSSERERPDLFVPLPGEPSLGTPERFCPNCGTVLLERKCKLVCTVPTCGYFMSCSDFY